MTAYMVCNPASALVFTNSLHAAIFGYLIKLISYSVLVIAMVVQYEHRKFYCRKNFQNSYQFKIVMNQITCYGSNLMISTENCKKKKRKRKRVLKRMADGKKPYKSND
jgi:hypothetical protein